MTTQAVLAAADGSGLGFAVLTYLAQRRRSTRGVITGMAAMGTAWAVVTVAAALSGRWVPVVLAGLGTGLCVWGVVGTWKRRGEWER